MNILTYIKLGALFIAIAWIYHMGGEANAAKLAEFESKQSLNTANAVLAERASAQAELTRVNTVVAHYEATPIDPIAVTVGSRVFKYASAASCAVPKATAVAGGTSGSTGVAPGPSGVEQALANYIRKCNADAARLAAVMAAWPQ